MNAFILDLVAPCGRHRLFLDVRRAGGTFQELRHEVGHASLVYVRKQGVVIFSLDLVILSPLLVQLIALSDAILRENNRNPSEIFVFPLSFVNCITAFLSFAQGRLTIATLSLLVGIEEASTHKIPQVLVDDILHRYDLSLQLKLLDILHRDARFAVTFRILVVRASTGCRFIIDFARLRLYNHV